ncbi:hypothetical protein ABIB57_000391 [Devosia sp. UYZn731]|uniref:hypothetical protein n=1 Tax=Devosia sp. UYZn731 TaxID=3156345 RepID=UPI0033951BEC
MAQASVVERLEGRFTAMVLMAVWLLFFGAPLTSLSGLRDGVFISSDAWNALWPQSLAVGTAVELGILLLAICMSLAAWQRNYPGPLPKIARKIVMWTLIPFALLLPLLGLGVERGIVRVWAHEMAPTLGRVSTTAVVSSYYQRKGGSYRLVVRIPPYGWLRFSAPHLAPGIIIEPGMEISVIGRRTWVGVYYSTVDWPKDWLASR